MLRLRSECPGQRVGWALTSSLKTAHCPPLPPVHATKTTPTTLTTTTCSSIPSILHQTPRPSSQPQEVQPATDRPAIRGPRLRLITATTTAAHYHTHSLSSPRPPTEVPYRSAMAICPRPRTCLRPTASCRASSSLLRPLHHCPPPPSQPPTSTAWEECPLWCLRKTKQVLWSKRSAIPCT